MFEFFCLIIYFYFCKLSTTLIRFSFSFTNLIFCHSPLKCRSYQHACNCHWRLFTMPLQLALQLSDRTCANFMKSWIVYKLFYCLFIEVLLYIYFTLENVTKIPKSARLARKGTAFNLINVEPRLQVTKKKGFLTNTLILVLLKLLLSVSYYNTKLLLSLVSFILYFRVEFRLGIGKYKKYTCTYVLRNTVLKTLGRTC